MLINKALKKAFVILTVTMQNRFCDYGRGFNDFLMRSAHSDPSLKLKSRVVS